MHVLLKGMPGHGGRLELSCCHRIGAAPLLDVWSTVKVALASPKGTCVAQGALLWSLKVTALAFGRPTTGSGVSM